LHLFCREKALIAPEYLQGFNSAVSGKETYGRNRETNRKNLFCRLKECRTVSIAGTGKVKKCSTPPVAFSAGRGENEKKGWKPENKYSSPDHVQLPCLPGTAMRGRGPFKSSFIWKRKTRPDSVWIGKSIINRKW